MRSFDSRRARPPSLAATVLFVAAAIGVLQFLNPPTALHARRARLLAGGDSGTLAAEPSPNAFGRSGQVKVRFALPGALFDYPLEVKGDPSALSYTWSPLRGSDGADT